MIVVRKKTILMVTLCIMLAVTGYLDYQYNSLKSKKLAKNSSVQTLNNKKDPNIKITDSKGKSTNTTESTDVLESFKEDRDSTRKQEIAYLDSIINNKVTDKETLKNAQSQKLDLINSMEKEVTVEGVLKTKGLKNSIITIHKNSINVIVQQSALSQPQVAQILDVVKRETGEKTENIKIIPSN